MLFYFYMSFRRLEILSFLLSNILGGILALRDRKQNFLINVWSLIFIRVVIEVKYI